jgi:glutathionylspermidine synthase
MDRLPCVPRVGLREQLMQSGLVYLDTTDPVTGREFLYWPDNAYYALTSAEVAELRRVCTLLTRMFIDAGDYIIQNNLFAKLGIPGWMVPAIKKTWEDDSPEVYWPSFYGRFDIRWGGFNHPGVATDATLRVPKLLEYNADTPTALPESTTVQWEWLQAMMTGNGQWNDTYECLVLAWIRSIERYEERSGRPVSVVHIAHSSEDTSGEDQMNAAWVGAAAEEAAAALRKQGKPGFEVKYLTMEQIQIIQHNDQLVSVAPGETELINKGYFLDGDGKPIHVIFKLYPWEWMFNEAFGKTAAWNMLQPKGTIWIEPPYKALWSNKGILPILWELYKDDPVRSEFLLPAYFEGEEPAGFAANCARKPLLGREGASVTLMQGGEELEAHSGEYGAEGFVLQQLAPLPAFDGVGGPWHPVLGVWCIDNEGAAGLGIRESRTLVTDNQSCFAPHVIDDTRARQPA